MKIAVINIDWFKKPKVLKQVIIDEVNKLDLDFLIVNENIESFNFNLNYNQYHSEAIPIIAEFQHLNYGVYLKGETPVRTSIFSKYKSIKRITTQDKYTSICHQFLIDEIEFAIYGTIIGTWGIKYQKDIGQLELSNFKTDAENILKENPNLFIVGDFNTSFIEKELRQLSTINTRLELLNFTNQLKIHRATEKIENCIDHIFISENMYQKTNFNTSSFLDNDILKDNPHKGVLVEINFKRL